MMRVLGALGLAGAWLLSASQPTLAHGDGPLAPHDLPAAWSFDLTIVLPLLVAAGLYITGIARVWRRAGGGRGVSYRHAAAFLGGWFAIYVALISPLDALSDALFSAHMVQHLVLILVAAPLLVLANPLSALVWGLPALWRPRFARVWLARTPLHQVARQATKPLAAWVLHAAAVWFWHIPALYERALASETVHAVEHASFFITALLFWWALIRGRGRVLHYGAAALFVFTMALQGTLLGALITFSPTPWYPSYATSTAAWGLSPLTDQQIAGGIMWVPPGILYLGIALALLVAWMRAVEKRLEAREAHAARFLADPNAELGIVREREVLS